MSNWTNVRSRLSHSSGTRSEQRKIGGVLMKRIDRYRGSLTGLAAGDALGTTLDFAPPGTFDPIDDIVGGGAFQVAPGKRHLDGAGSGRELGASSRILEPFAGSREV
jgi:hypothetical protein